jgi:hypothetical protein
VAEKQAEWRIVEEAKFGEGPLFANESEHKRIQQDSDGLLCLLLTRQSMPPVKEYLPTSVKKSKTTTAGPMSGKMRENVHAKMRARTHAPVANVGS